MKEPRTYFHSVNQFKAVLDLKTSIAWKVIGIQREVSFFIKPRLRSIFAYELFHCFIDSKDSVNFES